MSKFILSAEQNTIQATEYSKGNTNSFLNNKNSYNNSNN